MISLLPILLTLAAQPTMPHTPDLLPGRVGGAGQTTTRVEAYDTDVFEIDFRGGETALVVLRGDGDTDLDLFVYDENDNLVAVDDDSTDQCVARWTPRWTGTFRVEVRNLGDVFNRYTIRSN